MKTLQILVISILVFECGALSQEDGDLRPRFSLTARTDFRLPLEELFGGFDRVLLLEFESSFTNRFNSNRYLSALRYGRSMPEFGWRESRAAFRNGLTGALKDYFVEDPVTSLPIVNSVMEILEDVTSGKFAQFARKTLFGGKYDDQMVSPFSSYGFPLQEENFFSHKFNFGLRPIKNDNPYGFLGYTARIDGEEVVGAQLKLSLKNWQYPVPEFVVKVPMIETWSLGMGLRYQSLESLRSNSVDSEWDYSKQKGLSYFLGLQSFIWDGRFFVGTGYPETFSLVFEKRL